MSRAPTSAADERGKGDARTTAGSAALAAAGVYVCARLGYAYAVYPSHISVVWPASGFLLALLILIERRRWPAALLGAVAANVVADLQHGTTVGVALAGGGANAFESLVAALVLMRLAGRRPSLRSLRELGALIVGAAIMSNAVTSLLGALVLTRAWRLPFGAGWESGLARAWFVWWAGDGMGMLVVAPAILTWAGVVRARERIPRRMALEAALVLLVTIVVAGSVLVRGGASGGALGGYPYLVFPLLIWTGIRFGPWGPATATLLLAAVVSWHASREPGLFIQQEGSSLQQVLEIYAYLALASLSSLVPAVALRERADAEEQLRQSDARFRQMADTIKESYYVVDLLTWTPIYVSPIWSEIWGRPLEEGYDPDIWFDNIHPDDREAMRRDQETVARGEPATTVFRVIRPDGATRWVRGRSFPVRDPSGTVYRMIGVAEDITELRQSEERVIQAQRMEAVGQLAGGVAHDFNNLLTVILGSADLALADLPHDAPLRDDLVAIRDAGESATRLTRQLLAFSRQQILQPHLLRLDELIQTTAGMLERLIGENIQLQTSLQPGAGSVNADPGSLEQVLVNLAVNARDAMPAGGRLLLELRNADVAASAASDAVPPGRYVVLAVSDTGVGMDPETRARVFEPFFTTKEPGRGTGLGLATVYGIVRQSDGHIAVHSEPGRGTRFELYLPRADTPAAPLPAPPPRPPLPATPACILIVEDQRAVRGIMHQILTRRGYHVLSAASGEEALAVARSHPAPIDLLLTDVVMPGMSGPDLARSLAELRPATRVLFTSGYTDDALLRHGIVAAEVDYLEKPFTPDSLTRTVRRVLEAPPRGAGADA